MSNLINPNSDSAMPEVGTFIVAERAARTISAELQSQADRLRDYELTLLANSRAIANQAAKIAMLEVMLATLMTANNGSGPTAKAS